MGQFAGVAASLRKWYDARPHDVYIDRRDDLKRLMTRGVGKLPPPAAKPPI